METKIDSCIAQVRAVQESRQFTEEERRQVETIIEALEELKLQVRTTTLEKERVKIVMTVIARISLWLALDAWFD